MSPATTQPTKRLWETDHPFFGADGYQNPCESFDDLKAHLDSLDPDMNHIYRWDWKDWSQPHFDTLCLDSKDRSEQELSVYIVMPRKDALISFTCPITHEQEAEVREWLNGPRVLGALRTLWEPLLEAGTTR